MRNVTVLVPRKQLYHTCNKLSIHEYSTVFLKNVTHVDMGMGFTVYLHLLIPHNPLVCQTDQSRKLYDSYLLRSLYIVRLLAHLSTTSLVVTHHDV